MTIFAVFEARHQAHLDAPEVVPEKFSWLAFLLPPVYAVAHGLWLELLGFFALVILAVVIGALAGEDAGLLCYLALALLIGLEAPTIRAAALSRKGFEHRADLIAAGPDLAAVAWLDRDARS